MNLKDLRLKKKLTQKQLAELLGMSTSHIQKLETGTRKPGLVVAKKLAKLYNVSINRLFFTDDTHK